MRSLAGLAATLPQVGTLAWIGVRRHGGIAAAIVTGGLMRFGDAVTALEPA